MFWHFCWEKWQTDRLLKMLSINQPLQLLIPWITSVLVLFNTLCVHVSCLPTVTTHFSKFTSLLCDKTHEWICPTVLTAVQDSSLSCDQQRAHDQTTGAAQTWKSLAVVWTDNPLLTSCYTVLHSVSCSVQHYFTQFTVWLCTFIL